MHSITVLQLKILLCASLVCLSSGSKTIYPLKVSPEKWVNNLISESKRATPKLSCPPWKYDKFHNSSCVCGDSIHNIVHCNEDDDIVSLLTCHCMSYSDHSDMLLVGNCPYLCTNDFYVEISEHENISDLCNRDIEQNRKGQMCGKCLDNFAPSPFSYSFECSNCSNHKYNWAKYIVSVYLPLTVFFLAVIIFRFNAMSPSINSFILVCQILSCPSVNSLVNVYVHYLDKNTDNPNNYLKAITKSLSVIYGIWNLDFFRMVYKPFCLYPSMSILQTMSLDYAIAVYPLVLVFFVYFLVKLHEQFEIVRFLWRPAAWLFTCASNQWRASNSFIQAFGTFFLLSYVKIINTSFNILMPVQLRNVSGQVFGLYVYYNGSLEYFGHDHRPYAVLATCMLTIFNIMPLLLLCLYPCQFFQSCLNCCQLNSQVLRTFMEAFQGCYKFEPYDCRYWAAFYLFLRIGVLVTFALTQSGYFVLIAGILLVPTTSLLLIVRPYRHNIYNVIDAVMLLTLIQLCFSAAGFSLSAFDRRYEAFVSIMFGIGVFCPLIYATLLLIKTITPNNLSVATRRYILCTVLPREDDRLQIRESTEEPLLREYVDSAESEEPQ